MFKLTNIAFILFATTLVNIFTTYVSWRKRRSAFGLYFAMGMVSITLWTFAAGLDYAAVPIPLKVFFAKLEYVGTHGALALLAVSMILYAGHENWLKKTWIKFLFIAIPVSNILLAWTNDWHGWLWSGFAISDAGNNVIVFAHGPAFIWTILTGYLLITVIGANLLQVVFTGAVLARKQARLLLIVIMIPVASNLLYLFDVLRTPGVDWSSITFSLAGLLFLVAIYGLRFMEIIPIARNLLIEKMTDGILVLDSRENLVDFNPTAQAIFGFNRGGLGTSFQTALACCPEIIALLENSSGTELKQVGFRYKEEFFDFHLTPLVDQMGGIYGKLVVIRNVSESHRAERALRESEERYQSFLSHSFEAIYRTEFDKPIDISLPVETQIDQIYANAYMAECNQALADMYRIPSIDALIGARLLDAHGGSDNPVNRAAFRKFIQGGYRSINDETVERDSQGNAVWFLSNSVGVVEDGLLLRMWGTSINITERKLAEEALRRREMEYQTLVENSPDAVTRFDRQGHYVYVNQARAWYFGRTVEEILGKTVWDLIGPDEVEEGKLSDAALKRVFENPQEYTVEYQTKTPSGMRWVQSRGTPEFAEDGTVKSVLVITRDITERKRAEEIIRLRLRLWEYASTHTVEELMKRALDEICNITESKIGFYHFVEKDQDTLSLQAWSTRTASEFCTAVGKGMHYPISEAGVWVDCVRERKPVIHNDYESLPHRRGLPAGHAEIVRELVVPTMRNDQVVSILGVGNKPTYYDEDDIALVSYIADIIWIIVENKRAEEQIRALNTKLEQLAMTDEVTGIFNRRLFFQRGAEEIQRTERYFSPLSLLMLDIDDFKRVNDAYGHDVGDRVLRCVADTLRSNIREIDVLARLGGEEFGILLPNTEGGKAVVLAERLRLEIEQATRSVPGQDTGVTLSIGVASIVKDVQNIDQLLKNADIAMYRSKNSGRNKVTQY